MYKCVASPPVGWHGIVSVNEEKPRKLPQLECHPLSSMRVKIELLTERGSQSIEDSQADDAILLRKVLPFTLEQMS